MRVVKKDDFGSIESYELGWSLIGKPLMTARFYVLGNTLIDTGQAHMEKESLQIAQECRACRIFLTHHHEDHSGNAGAISRKLDIPVYGHNDTIRKMATRSRIFPYQHYTWGHSTPLTVQPLEENIQTDLGPLVPYHAPGHAKDHTIYLLKDQGILFSGDLYLADRIRYFRADENLGDQIASLKKAVTLDFELLLCGHYPRPKNGRQHLLNKLAFLEDFYGSILNLYQQGNPPKTIFQKLGFKESTFIKYFCFGNVSMMNGVKSVIRHYESTIS